MKAPHIEDKALASIYSLFKHVGSNFTFDKINKSPDQRGALYDGVVSFSFDYNGLRYAVCWLDGKFRAVQEVSSEAMAFLILEGLENPN